MSDTNAPWWPLALARELAPGKPLGAFVGDEPIVLFRDQTGTVRALENRCPHRRVPLSLGRVRGEGWLQCGYHGWSFDGETGRCRAIPNLRADEKVPDSYGVYPYSAVEHNGFVYVATASQGRALPDTLIATHGRQFDGRLTVGLGADHYIAALMDGPQLLLRATGLRIAETLVADPHLDRGWLTMERAAFWLGQPRFDGFVREYPLVFRLALHPQSGEAWLSFLKPDDSLVAAAHWAITPSARGTTAVLWRSFAPQASGLRPALLGLSTALGRAPIAPLERVDLAAVSQLLPGPSEHWNRRGQDPGLYGDILFRERASA